MADNETLELARGVASICGPHSGAARAVALYERLSSEGKAPLLIHERGRWVVIHDPESAASAQGEKE